MFINMFASANLRLVSEMERILGDMEPFKKPVIASLCALEGIWDKEKRRTDGEKGIVLIRSPERAAKAMANLYKAKRMGQ